MLPARDFLCAFINFGTYIPYKISPLEKTDDLENSNIPISCTQLRISTECSGNQMLCFKQETWSQMDVTALTSPTSSLSSHQHF